MAEKSGDHILLGLIFLSSASEQGNALLKRLASEFSNIQGLEIGSNWEELDGGELAFQLRRYSHIVMILDERSPGSRWLSYLAGYAMGNRSVLLFYRESEKKFPHYLNTFPVYGDAPALMDALHEEVERHQIYCRVEEAREELIGRGFGLNDQVFVDAVADNRRDVVELFLTVGFSPDTCDSKDVALLNHAVRGGHDDIIVLLLENGADPNAVSGDRGNTPVMDAASTGQTELVRLLLAAGADPDVQSKSGQTGLMMAVGEGFAQISSLFIEAGCDLSVTDQLGMTAEKYARLFNSPEIVSLFE
ncbi:ankyrin repeat domain-containing protein [Salinispira pacifica]|uniref:ankyrin repeat domain-containing protein n=1 Tax=Salinispira pacifica TaxID=1307761 RepID=UPI00059E19A9|nr:ankyrin repeat domain-containing protein [Salinispira pacifica]